MLDILYQDNHIVAINKPHGLLVHRSNIDHHETEFALQLTRDQIGQHVFPVHRIDKPTSGVLLFALDRDTARYLSGAFDNNKITKTYHAVVRGYTPISGTIDHPLSLQADTYQEKAKNSGETKPATTFYKTLETIEIPVNIEKYPTSRYSLIECMPITGRKHQIRRHCKHISHPIIGDARHGRGRHNRYFKEHLDCGRLLLHASTLKLIHPINNKTLSINAPFDNTMKALLQRFNWKQVVNTAHQD